MKLDPAAACCLPEKLCRELKAVAFARRDRELLVAVAYPQSLLELRLGCGGFSLSPVVAPLALVEEMLARTEWPEASPPQLFAAGDRTRSRLPGWVVPSAQRQIMRAVHLGEPPILRVVDVIISQSILDEASEIQVVPGAGVASVYFRVDGILQEIMSPPRHIHESLLARLRQMAQMTSDETMGWLGLMHDGAKYDFHLKFLPTTQGELCVLERPVRLDVDLPESFCRALRQPTGLLVVEAPEGHGLRLTFGAVLSRLRERLPVAVASWSCAWSEIPVVWAPSGQDALLEGLLAYAPQAVVVEELTDGGPALQRLAQRCLVVAGVRQEFAGPCLGILRQRLVRSLCSACAESVGELRRGRGCDRCMMVGSWGARWMGHWSEDPGSLEDLVWERVRAGQVSAEEAREVGLAAGG